MYQEIKEKDPQTPTASEEAFEGKVCSDLFDHLESVGIDIPAEDRERIIGKLHRILSYEPRIGFFGKTGVGKSSLCNALFGQDVAAISDIEACTRQPQEIILKVANKGIKLIDVPGVGECEARDEEYAELYQNLLPELDVVLWLLKGDDRAFSIDERFYKNFVRPHIEEGKPFLFVINQIDKLEPSLEWDRASHRPGPKQLSAIERKIAAVSRSFECPKSQIICVSANEKYNLVPLVDEVVHRLPNDKKVTFLRRVEREHRSEKAEKEATRGIWETIKDTAVEVYNAVKEFISSIPWPSWPW